MTSLTSIGPEQQHLEGRSVRDIVEYSPEQVNEVWCRKIFRQILQSLELQYAMHMPHRAITPDTIVFHDNGEPLLIPLDVTPEETREAEDLSALARIIHYAITRELAPTGPLEGRVQGYSDSLVKAVDRCMDPDPARRPASIAALRDLLGIVPMGPPVMPHMILPDDDAIDAAAGMAHRAQHAPTAAAPAVNPAVGPPPGGLDQPSFMQGGARPRRGISLNRWQRWAVAAGGGAVLVALALAMFAEMRDSGSFDHIVLTLPQQADTPRNPAAAGTPAASVPYITDDPPGTTAAAAATPPFGAPPAANPADTQITAAATTAADVPTGTPADGAVAPSTPAAAAVAAAAAARPAPAGRLPGVVVTPEGNLYRLQIQPWGVVYVDGVDRGVSPPIKRIALPPGRHTIRVTNPNFHDRVLDVDTASGDGQITVDFNDGPR